jgi:hypothetical protein
MDKLPLDDPRWCTIKAAIDQRDDQTGSRTVAIIDLEKAMASGKLRSKRRNTVTGKYELVSAPYWRDHVIDITLPSSITVYRRTAVDATPQRWATFAHQPADRIDGWLFYVWKPDLDGQQVGGAPFKFTPEQQRWLQNHYRLDLFALPTLKKQDAAVPHVMEMAKAKYGIEASRNTLLDHIIRPVLRAAKKNQ